MKKIRSWDLFDTLIGRRCGTPARLWEEISTHIDDPHFVERRILAEERAKMVASKVHREYSLRDIHLSMDHPFVSVRDLVELELQYELANIFPIRRHVEQLRADDIIVSDMYLEEEQLRALMKRAGIEWNGQLYVSNKGKFDGSMWKRVRAAHSIELHQGDNLNTDVRMAKKHGVKAQGVKTGLNSFESEYESIVPGMGWWLRSIRLEFLRDERHADKLYFLQLEYNLPFLWACCHLLADYAKREGVKSLLFMSRDAMLLYNLFINLYPDIDAEYIWISRQCLRSDSRTFFDYLNRRLTEDAALVDLSASCGSLAAALPRLDVDSPRIWTAIFLAEPFRVELGRIRCEYEVRNDQFRINNTFVEMLNYATHWHVKVVADDEPIFDMHNEYDMDLVEAYHAIVRDAITVMPRLTFGSLDDVRQIFRRALQGIQAEGKFLQNTFPRHLMLERKRKRNNNG